MAPRKPWLALLMSLLRPGLGQLYNGEPRKALLVAAFYPGLLPFSSLATAVLPSAFSLTVFYLQFTALVAVYLWNVVDAGMSAKRRPELPPGRWNRGRHYVAFAVGTLLLQYGTQRFVRAYVLQPFKISADGMAPTLVPGDRFLVSKLPFNIPTLERGEIVAFESPKHPGVIYVKRVVGLPRDKVELRGGDLYVNGSVVAYRKVEEAGAHPDGLPEGAEAYEETLDGHVYATLRPRGGEAPPDLLVEVPEGTVFLLGDNRASSYDSRHYGPVPLAKVRGLALQVWLSLRPGGGARWTRFGKNLR